MRLVLASRSPRRGELLSALGVPFDVQPGDLDERLTNDGYADARRLACEKAAAAAVANPAAIVVTADTVVHVSGRTYGKPTDGTDAVRMLTELTGRTHMVSTGLAVAAVGRIDVRVTNTRVALTALSDADIALYVASGRPLDKAGAYAIQDDDIPTVRCFDGCYCAVVGLPLWGLKVMLEAAGLHVDEPVRRYGRCEECPERPGAFSG